MPKKERSKGYRGYTNFGVVYNGKQLADAMRDIYSTSSGPNQVEDLRVNPVEGGKVAIHYKRKGLDLKDSNEKGLKSKLTPMIVIGLIIIGLFFLSSNITGNVVGNLTQNSSNGMGAILIALGLIGAYFWKK